ncbi:MAG: transmembrane sensor [Roseivirga sp.]|jgi:transmembrane sensor
MEELVAKYLANELNANERTNFESQLIENEALSLELEAQSMIYELTDRMDSPVFDSESAWAKVDHKTKESKVIGIEKPKYTFIKIAAVLLVVAIAGFLVVENNKTPATDGNQLELISATNEFKEYTLPDGSVVKLNASSILKLASDFGEANRTVSLVGEANFDIIRNENLPFIIQAGNAKVRVLGTSFNLTTNLNQSIELNVTEGSVEFSSIKNEKITEKVVRGEMAMMDKTGQSIKKETIKNTNYSGWWTKRFEYENTFLAEVIRDLEDAYRVKIEYNKEISSCPITGTYENKSIKEIIDLIDVTFPTITVISFKENRIKLEGNGCTN